MNKTKIDFVGSFFHWSDKANFHETNYEIDKQGRVMFHEKETDAVLVQWYSWVDGEKTMTQWIDNSLMKQHAVLYTSHQDWSDAGDLYWWRKSQEIRESYK
jgi:hypothetical protein